jgi:hypothetical protein
MWLDGSEVIQKEIPKLHPLSMEYLAYWKEEKKRVVEGLWHNGIWCPPQLYHYYNHATITVGEGKKRYKSKPWNLDYVWDLAYYWIETKGLSGFEKIGDVKDIRSFLRQRQSESDLGKPLYNNQAQNLLVMGPRGWGKSYWAANCAAHEFITDGQKEYKPGVEVTELSEILLSAYATPYVNDLITKIQDILNGYQGGMLVGDVYYPAPFHRTVSGTWQMGKKVEYYYQKKTGGKWKWYGTRSCFKPRVYKDNFGAGLGGRNTLKIGEEIGVWDNLIESHYADENTQKLNNYKFGSSLYIGTGGDMIGGGTLASQKMMYDPEAYDCLVFDDKYEKRGKIGLFFPTTYTKIDYKDANGITNWELAKYKEEEEREKKKKSKDAQSYDEYVVYNPLVPSEIFLSKSGNKFPLKDLQTTLANVEGTSLKDAEWIGDLLISLDGNVEWKNNAKNRPIYDFPLRSMADRDGSVIIYEHPKFLDDGSVVPLRYIAGIDPYDHDNSNTDSLGCVIIMDRLTNRIVAEYTGRPTTAREFYEIVRRLLIYYNAIAMYENEKKGIFDYFESQNSLYLLAEQPKLIKDVVANSTVQRGYGIHMSQEIKFYGEGLINQFLREKNDAEFNNTHKIRAIGLLKELILFNHDGNFDRVMALMCCMYLREEMRRVEVKQDERVKGILESDFFKNGMVRNSIMANLR